MGNTDLDSSGWLLVPGCLTVNGTTFHVADGHCSKGSQTSGYWKTSPRAVLGGVPLSDSGAQPHCVRKILLLFFLYPAHFQEEQSPPYRPQGSKVLWARGI